MNKLELLGAISIYQRLSSQDEIESGMQLLGEVRSLSPAEKLTLEALFYEGPLEDGDVPSKTGRDALIQRGMAIRIVVKGQEGYNACTLRGSQAKRLLDVI